MHRYLLLTATAMALSVPALADWPGTARSGFIAECIESALIEHASADAQAFCECAADQASQVVDPTELEAMGDGTVDPATQERLIEASRSCAGHLSS